MANTIKIRRSTTASSVPTTTQLDQGELAVNVYDGKLFFKKVQSGVESIVTLQESAASGITSLNSQTGATQTFAIGSGNSSGQPYWASASNTHTLHLPTATNAIRGLVSNGTQTFGGRKNLLDGATVGDTIGAGGRLHVWNSGTTPAVYSQQTSTGTGDLFRGVTSAGTTVFSVSTTGAVSSSSTLSTTGGITCGGTFTINANAIASTTDINLTPGSTADRVIFNNLGTTSSSANAVFGSGGGLVKSTSSIRYKTDVQDLPASTADEIVAQLRAVQYKSLASGDSPDDVFYGLIAEEVAPVAPNLVAYALIPEVSEEHPVPDGVAYDRIGIVLLPIIQRQRQQISLLQTELAHLRERLELLEAA
jgi:hypothetical protein